MALYYRAHRNPNVPCVFSGDGGLYTAGRWNHKGKKIVYCSQSIALATMEWLAHNELSVSGFSYHKFVIDVPDNEIIKFTLAQLPADWDKEPAVTASRDFSDTNLFQTNGPLGITVPSIMIPEENNLLLNPLHPNYISVLTHAKHLGQFQAPVRAI